MPNKKVQVDEENAPRAFGSRQVDEDEDEGDGGESSEENITTPLIHFQK
jgi:hypothetical protein